MLFIACLAIYQSFFMTDVQNIRKQISLSIVSKKIVGTYEITKLHGDASNREYFRIEQNGKKHILMLLPSNKPESLAEEYSKDKLKGQELPFIQIQRHFAKKGVRVPEVIAVDVENRLLLLEDFGDDLLLAVVQKDSSKIEPLYKNALNELSRISVITEKDPKDSIAFTRKFDKDLYNWEFKHFIEYGIEKKIKGYKETDTKKIMSELEKITDIYIQWPEVLCHRDYHSRNVIVLPSNEIGVIDFQDALMAPLYYDLISLLKDSYFELSRNQQETLAFYYKDKIHNTLSQDEFLYGFDLMSLHRNLKAAGRFSFFDLVKGNDSYLKDVPRTLSYVKKTLEVHPELKNLKNLLTPYLEQFSVLCQS